MGTADIIWLVVGIAVVLAVIVAVAALLRRRKHQYVGQRRAQADELRHEAVGHTDDVRQAQVRALEAQAEAEQARQQAERAEREASIADRNAAALAARQEDVVREADRLDPRVDHQAADYQPTTDPLALKDPLEQPEPARTEVER